MPTAVISGLTREEACFERITPTGSAALMTFYVHIRTRLLNPERTFINIIRAW